MEFEKVEVVKVFEYYFSDLRLKVILKINKTEGGSIYFSTSHYYKPKKSSPDYYMPGAGANSVDSAVEKGEVYLQNFTADYILNPSF